MIIDTNHPLAFLITPYLDGEEVLNAIAGLFPNEPGCTEFGWLRCCKNLVRRESEPIDLETREGQVSWEWMKDVPMAVIAAWTGGDNEDATLPS
jgi:hypothetical protein